MAIFSRRELQKRLNILSRILGVKKLRQIVKSLNIEGSVANEKRFLESLSTAWEVVILSAFVELGNTKHEKEISNGKKPDIFYSDNGISFIGDVFTISDEQQHIKNPVDEFSNIIQKIWRNEGPKTGALSWDIKSVCLKPPPTPKPKIHPQPLTIHLSSRLRPINRRSIPRICLPPLKHLDDYLNKTVSPFIRELAINPNNPKRIDIDEYFDEETIVRFSITYNPKKKYFTGTHQSYTTVTDIERHVLWRRLLEKRKQFLNANENMPRILFVCDGNSQALKATTGGGSDYQLEEVLDHFWKRPRIPYEQSDKWIVEKDISAAISFSIISNPRSFGFDLGDREFHINPKLFINPHCNFPLDENAIELVNQAISKIPIPIESPQNVLIQIKSNPNKSRHLGRLTMSGDKIEISSIDLLHILSGQLSIDDFCKNYRLEKNPFLNFLLNSQTIKTMKVESAGERDDDKIIIEFNSYDPAIGPFIVPKKGK